MASFPQAPYDSTTIGTHTHPTSEHLGSLAWCFLNSVAWAAAVADTPAYNCRLCLRLYLCIYVLYMYYISNSNNNNVGRNVCPFCQDVALDPLGHHAVTCRHGGDVVIRHNHLRDVFVDFCQRAHLSVSVEKGHGLTRDHSHTRPADVLIAGWDRGRPAAFNISTLPSHTKGVMQIIWCSFYSSGDPQASHQWTQM